MPDIISLQTDTIFAAPPTGAFAADTRVDKTKASLNDILQRYFAQQGIDNARIAVNDSFYFIFNINEFSRWPETDWWTQRRILRQLKTETRYVDRAKVALQHSFFRRFYEVEDSQVGYSTDPRVHYAWMRKRLFLYEAYWNSIDTIAFAAFHEKKYENMFPGTAMLLFNLTNVKNDDAESMLLADNGAGTGFKKSSKDSGALRFLLRIWKLVHRRGLYQLGGLNLGLQETCGELHCFGTGAVTTQCSYEQFSRLW